MENEEEKDDRLKKIVSTELSIALLQKSEYFRIMDRRVNSKRVIVVFVSKASFQRRKTAHYVNPLPRN